MHITIKCACCVIIFMCVPVGKGLSVDNRYLGGHNIRQITIKSSRGKKAEEWKNVSVTRMEKFVKAI